MKKRIIFASAMFTTIIPCAFIVSCGTTTPSTGTVKHSKEYEELKKIIDSKEVTSFFNMKPNKFFNVKNISKFSRINFLENVELSNEFINADKTNAFKAVSFLNLVPEENTKNALIIAFLGNSDNDSNVLQMGKLENALENNFHYNNKITLTKIKLDDKNKYKNKKDIENDLKTMKETKGVSKEILSKSFEGDIDKLIGDNFDKFSFELDTNYRLIIRISDNLSWNDGTVFQIQNELTREIVSNTLI